MIDPVIGRFKITQYNKKRSISISNLVETTQLTRYPVPTEIAYDQGSELIGHGFIKSLIKTQYGITEKPITSENPTSNVILERIHKVLGNPVRTFSIKTMLTKMTYGRAFWRQQHFHFAQQQIG